VSVVSSITEAFIYRKVLSFLFRELVKKYDEHFKKESCEELKLSDMSYFNSIVKRIYDHELEKVERELNKTLDRLVDDVRRLQERIINEVKQLMITLGELGEEERANTVNEIAEAGLFRYGLVNYLVSLRSKLSDVLSERTFMYAVYLAMLLEKRVDSERVEIRIGDSIPIHKVWSALAERGVRLLREPGIMCVGINNVVDVFEKSCKKLLESRESIEDLEDCLKSRDCRSKASEILAKYLEFPNISQELRGQIISYYLGHLEALSALPEMSAKSLKTYIDIVFCKKSFLEYETYSYLINNYVPALPRLQIKLDLHDMNENEEEIRYEEGVKEGEIDVLVATEDQLHVIEVTTRGYEELKNKLEKLGTISMKLNADETILITTKENCEKLKTSNYDIGCFSFENLHAYVQNLTKKALKTTVTL